MSRYPNTPIDNDLPTYEAVASQEPPASSAQNSTELENFVIVNQRFDWCTPNGPYLITTWAAASTDETAGEVSDQTEVWIPISDGMTASHLNYYPVMTADELTDGIFMFTTLDNTVLLIQQGKLSCITPAAVKTSFVGREGQIEYNRTAGYATTTPPLPTPPPPPTNTETTTTTRIPRLRWPAAGRDILSRHTGQ